MFILFFLQLLQSVRVKNPQKEQSHFASEYRLPQYHLISAEVEQIFAAEHGVDS